MKYILILPFLASCVATTSDLRDLADEIRDLPNHAEVAAAVNAKAEKIEERAKAIVDAATDPTSPSRWLELLGTAAATFGAVTVHRNSTRAKALANVQGAVA